MKNGFYFNNSVTKSIFRVRVKYIAKEMYCRVNIIGCDL